MIYAHTYDAPAHWAPYLVLHDASGITVSDKQEIDAWLQTLPPRAMIVSCVDSDFVGSWHGFITMMTTYDIHLPGDSDD